MVLQAEAVRQADDGADDGLVFRVIGDIAHEGLVDLQFVDLESLEVTQRGIAGAEVVYRHADAAFMQVVHHRDRAERVIHRDTLGQFELQILRRQLHRVENLRDHLGQIGMAELHCREVDRDDHRRHAAVHPRLHLASRSAQHPFADLQNLAAAFRDRNEFRR